MIAIGIKNFSYKLAKRKLTKFLLNNPDKPNKTLGETLKPMYNLIHCAHSEHNLFDL